MLAVWTSMPELALDDAEAAQLQDAIKRVAKHNNVAMTQKQLDYAMALYAIAGIYGTRIVAIYLSRSSGPPSPATAQPQERVVPFPVPQGSM
jgi:hypothetical protein